jgi:hypothetical protein
MTSANLKTINIKERREDTFQQQHWNLQLLDLMLVHTSLLQPKSTWGTALWGGYTAEQISPQFLWGMVRRLALMRHQLPELGIQKNLVEIEAPEAQQNGSQGRWGRKEWRKCRK